MSPGPAYGNVVLHDAATEQLHGKERGCFATVLHGKLGEAGMREIDCAPPEAGIDSFLFVEFMFEEPLHIIARACPDVLDGVTGRVDVHGGFETASEAPKQQAGVYGKGKVSGTIEKPRAMHRDTGTC